MTLSFFVKISERYPRSVYNVKENDSAFAS